MTNTERQSFKFVVKEGPDCLWIAAEPSGGGHIEALQSAILGLELQPGFPMHNAKALADLLNRTVSTVCLVSAEPYSTD